MRSAPFSFVAKSHQTPVVTFTRSDCPAPPVSPPHAYSADVIILPPGSHRGLGMRIRACERSASFSCWKSGPTPRSPALLDLRNGGGQPFLEFLFRTCHERNPPMLFHARQKV